VTWRYGSSSHPHESSSHPPLVWSTDQLAAQLGVDVFDVVEWQKRGIGPVGIRLAGNMRYRPADVEAWLNGLAQQQGTRRDDTEEDS
jgi:hypothetical protein